MEVDVLLPLPAPGPLTGALIDQKIKEREKVKTLLIAEGRRTHETITRLAYRNTDPPDHTGSQDCRSQISGEGSPDRRSTRPATPDDETVW
ncbi:hypothetical protein Nmel_000809 [Mimus melanotis]